MKDNIKEWDRERLEKAYEQAIAFLEMHNQEIYNQRTRVDELKFCLQDCRYLFESFNSRINMILARINQAIPREEDE